MLEEVADDGTNVDILAYTGDANLEAADAAHNEVDPDTCRTGFIESFHDIRIAQGVHFGTDPALLSPADMFSLAVDQVEETVLEPERCKCKAVPVAGFRIAGQHIEGAGRVLPDVITAGHQSDVCVDPGCGVIVVSGRQMHVTADAVVFTADDQSDLAVCLESCQTIDDVAARMLKLTRPDNVIFLVETGFEFDQDCNLLAVFSRLCQGSDDGRIAAHTVESLFDGQDLGVTCGLGNKVDDRLEGLVGVMHENIALADLFENITSGRQTRDLLRLGIAGFPQPLESVQTIQLHQESQIKRSIDLEDLFICHFEFLLQEVEEPGIHAVCHLQTDGIAPLSLFELLLDFFEKIGCVVLIDRQVRISGDTVRIGAHDIVIKEEAVKMMADDLLKEDHTALVRFGQFQDAGKHGRYLYSRVLEFFLAALCAFCLFGGFGLFALFRGLGLFVADCFGRLLQGFKLLGFLDHDLEFRRVAGCPQGFRLLGLLDGLFGLAQVARDTLTCAFYTGQKRADIQALIADQREGPRIVDCHGRQYRENFTFEVLVHEDALLSSQVIIFLNDLQSVFTKSRKKLVIVRIVLTLHKTVGVLNDQVQLFRRRQSCDIPFFGSRIDHVLQGCDPDHEKFIQVGCGDAQEFEPLKKRIILVSGFAEAAAVKLEPAQLAVLIIFGIRI